MNDIIHHFMTHTLNKIIRQFTEDCVTKGNFSEFTIKFKKELDNLGKEMCGKLLENLNDTVRQDANRSKKWVVERKSDRKTLTTVFGEMSYNRTYYKNKKNGTYRYLSDEIAGICCHQRLDKAVASKIIDLSTEISYEKSGAGFEISKQSVMNNVRLLNNIEVKLEKPKNKREVDILYIEADEDHVALQQNGCAEPKIVYIHEGYKKDVDNVKRRQLKNVHYITGLYKTKCIWEKVLEYIDNIYDIDNIKKVYISGDGAAWIKSAVNYIPKSKFILDRYHINSCILKATGHAKDVRLKLWSAINTTNKKAVKEAFKELLEEVDSNSRVESIERCKTYILGNWDSIKIRNINRDEIIGCSAEGHVSHILSARLSSRPLGWSEEGVDKMAKLRAFKKNGGNVYELVQLNKKKKRRIQSKEDISRILKSIDSEIRANVAGLPVIDYGKRTPLYIQLNGLQRIRNFIY